MSHGRESLGLGLGFGLGFGSGFGSGFGLVAATDALDVQAATPAALDAQAARTGVSIALISQDEIAANRKSSPHCQTQQTQKHPPNHPPTNTTFASYSVPSPHQGRK